MICEKCGAQILNDAKFCMECGAEVVEYRECDFETELEKMEKEWEKIDKENEKNGEVFHLFGGKIVLSQDDIFFKEIAVEIYRIISYELHNYEENYVKNVTSFKALMDQMTEVKERFLKVASLFSHMSKKVNVECDKEILLNAYMTVNERGLELHSVNAIYECFKSYEELQKQYDNISNLLELEKECRNKVVGIGHGVKGLLITSIEAGIINAGIGGLHDIKNNATRRSLEKRMQTTLDNFAKDIQVREKIFEFFEMDLNKLIEAYISFLCKKTGREFNYSVSYNRKEISHYVQKTKNMTGQAQRDQYLFLLSCFPWDEQMYIEVFKQYGDANNELSKYCDFFNVPYIRNYKKEIERQEKENEEKKRRQAIEAEEKKRRQAIEKAEREKKENERVIQEMKEIRYRKELENRLITNDFQVSDQDQEYMDDLRDQQTKCAEDIEVVKKEIKEQSNRLETVCEEKKELQSKLLEIGRFSFGEKRKIKLEIKDLETNEQKLTAAILEMQTKQNELEKLTDEVKEKEKRGKAFIIKKGRSKVSKELDQIYNQKAPKMAIEKESLTFGNKVRWDIIDRYGSQLLLTTYAVSEKKKYNDKMKNVAWENCSLREWLNGDYKNMTFNVRERNMLVNFSKLEVKDLVFLFSENEVKEYFPDELYRQCGLYGSRYHSTVRSRDNLPESWWLRSNKVGEEAPKVNKHGYISSEKITDENTYVRPVICIDMAKLFDEEEITRKYAELEKKGIV